MQFCACLLGAFTPKGGEVTLGEMRVRPLH